VLLSAVIFSSSSTELRPAPYAIELHPACCALQLDLVQLGLAADTLKATGMTQSLFEMRALDKWLMLRGGFSAQGWSVMFEWQANGSTQCFEGLHLSSALESCTELSPSRASKGLYDGQ
jgi:hypothetical protein